MSIAVAHKIRLVPNRAQEVYFRKACGTARHTFNWALAAWQAQYKNGDKPNALQLKKQFNAIKRTEFPWVSEVTKCAPEQAFVDLAAAFRRFFQKQNRYPKFKKKNKSKDSFYLSNDQFSISNKKVRIPKLGWVRMREPLRFSGKILSARVARTADQWHIAVTVEIPDMAHTTKNQSCVGIDVGLKTFAFMSTGQEVVAPKPLLKLQPKLKRLQRRHSHKQRGSSNRRKSAMKLARLHNRIANVRNDFLHKLSSSLATTVDTIAVETLNAKGMLRNHRLARHIADASFYEFARQLSYKKNWYGGQLVKADMFYPSSKTCSLCGAHRADLILADRLYECNTCGVKINRDFNAALNLHTLGLREIYACGQQDQCDCITAEVSQLVEAGINLKLVEITTN
jgi:putative transposase